MNEFTIILDDLSATLFPMLVNLTWQFALLAGCVWLVTRVGWVRSAPIQHMLWLMCVFSPALLVCLGLLLPNVNILLHEGIARNFRGAPSTTEDSMGLNRSEEVSYQWMERDLHFDSTAQSPYEENGSLSEIQSHLPTTAMSPVESSDSIRETSVSWLSYVPLMVEIVWIAGFGFSLLRLGRGVFGLRKLRKSAGSITSGSFLGLLETLKDRMDVRHPVTIAASQHVHTPISLGFWHPVILLPDQLGTDNPEGLRLALIHELAHIRRHDVLVNWCQRVFGAFCFFHPLFHLASRRLTQAREQICDNWVIQQSGKRGQYAAFLAGLLESATSNGMARAVSLAVVTTKHSVAERIDMILEHGNRGKTSLSHKTIVVVLLLGMALVILLSATRILPMPSSSAQDQDFDTQFTTTFDGSATIKPDASLLPPSVTAEGSVISGRYERIEVSTHATGTSHRSDDVYTFKTGRVSMESGQAIHMDMEVMIPSLETIIEGARANDSLVESGMGYVNINRMPERDGPVAWVREGDKTQELYGVSGDAEFFYAFEGEKVRLDEEEIVHLSNGETEVMRSTHAYDGEKSEALYYDKWGRGVSRRRIGIPDEFDLRAWGLTVYGVPLADFLQGDTDDKHLKAISVVVLGDEQIDGDKCHVVKAIIPGGVIKLWISPDKGYRIRKVTRRSSVSLITLRKYNGDMWIPAKIVTKKYTFDAKSKERKLSSEQEVTISEDFEINIDVPDNLFDAESDSGFWPKGQ